MDKVGGGEGERGERGEQGDWISECNKELRIDEIGIGKLHVNFSLSLALFVWQLLTSHSDVNSNKRSGKVKGRGRWVWRGVIKNIKLN